MGKAATDPRSSATQDRSAIMPGLRSLHLRHARSVETGAKVVGPVLVLYYRIEKPGLIQILRVLHERMEPSLHFPRE